MTQLLTASAPTSALAQAVLRPHPGANVSCYWCRKLLRACDGERTVAQVAELLHLPLQICLKLVKRAHQQGWAELSVQAPALPTESGYTAPLWDSLLEVLGPGGEALLIRAASMSRCQPRAVPVHQAANFLIGVELLLPESRRGQLVPLLDRLRDQYAS
ncbi:hypothetical protein [Deinococcus wulumuqiensis]|uniref:hypothetical protein n=1 Tax=Deinococcus wulumuqiensis TaxID=980427 RepID=UPI00242F4ED6|nr:hypothetical protein [Deinococcus wulumuqiensis]